MSGPIPVGLLPEHATVGESGELRIGGCDVAELAEAYGTPLFIYDEQGLRNRCREATAVFGERATYAAKAFLCRAMVRLVMEEGMSIDVASGGELGIALAAGAPPERIHLHGNNKSSRELAAAMDAGVGRIIVDSLEEIDRIERLVAQRHRAPRVLLRLTPGVKAETHEFVATGHDDSKFGFTVSTGAAATAVERADASAAMDLVGLHVHIGSQVFDADSFAKALAVMAEVIEPWDLPELVLGGGLGVPYVTGETAPTITEWAEALEQTALDLGITAKLGVEPGRAIAARAAVTVYRVGTIKRLPDIRTYVAVDGGMSDNPRPVLYGSGYEAFLPRAVQAARPQMVRIVGKHCESGDILVREAAVPGDLAVGDLLATAVTGAYGHSMGSNYNKIARPPVVFCAEGDARLVVRRETLDDLLAADVG
ncbi:diaminopimelate decarboxylase [Euzebya tangerina]|uniref:diaminopimelate decarboxylase n=1 Tax=Euzebya tangerina TaxID=591198 RepID=UPI000E31B423|nr:diaminopimelate decarboxylase [Euzebya tangerina]